MTNAEDLKPDLVRRLGALAARVDDFVQTTTRLKGDWRNADAIQEVLEKKRASGKLTVPDEDLIAGKSHETAIAERMRINSEISRIAEEVRPGLLREIWNFAEELEIADPERWNFGQTYQQLIDDSVVDGESWWVVRFLPRLCTLLRNTHRSVSAEWNSLADPEPGGKAPGVRPRGRPTTILPEAKSKALALRKSGAKPDEIARTLYGSAYD